MGAAVVEDDLLTYAGRLADAAETQARSDKIAVCISVVDLHGNPVLFRRMSGSKLIAIEMAVLKARTAVALDMSTADLFDLVQPGQPLFSLTASNGGRYVAFGGGIPVHARGRLLVGLGVSGGTVDEDTALADAANALFQSMEDKIVEK